MTLGLPEPMQLPLTGLYKPRPWRLAGRLRLAKPEPTLTRQLRSALLPARQGLRGHRELPAHRELQGPLALKARNVILVLQERQARRELQDHKAQQETMVLTELQVRRELQVRKVQQETTVLTEIQVRRERQDRKGLPAHKEPPAHKAQQETMVLTGPQAHRVHKETGVTLGSAVLTRQRPAPRQVL